jgi:hypothetical protein
MEPTNSTSSWLEVSDTRAAEVLTDWRRRRYLEAFVPGPRGMSEAAEGLGVKLNALHYRVAQLIDLKLLEVKGSARRGGRAVKLYGPAAATFFVPFAATPHATMVDMLRRLGALDVFLEHAVAVLTAESERWGVLVSETDAEEGQHLGVKLAPLDAQGAPAPRAREALLASTAPAVWSGETHLTLDFGTAKALQRELAELTERFLSKQCAGGQAYHVVLGLTPIPGS